MASYICKKRLINPQHRCVYVRLTVLSCHGQGILRYQSDLLRYLGTLLFLPAFLSGAAEQKQILDVELFSDYTDDPVSPALQRCLIMCLIKYFVEAYLVGFFFMCSTPLLPLLSLRSCPTRCRSTLHISTFMLISMV